MRSITLVAVAMIAGVSTGHAQLPPDFDNPCRAEVELYLSIPSYSDGLWGSTQLLSDFAWMIRGDLLRVMNEDVKRIQAQLPTASADERAVMLGQLRAFRKCLPWLLALLGRVERRLKELGANVLLSVGPTRERREAEALFKEIAEHVAVLGGTLDRILSQHGGSDAHVQPPVAPATRGRPFFRVALRM